LAKTSRKTRLPEGARRLRCTVGSSDKFYDIILEDETYTVNYGRWGSSGAFQTKEFDTAREARREYDKVIRSKLQKGYLDVTGQDDQNSETTRRTQRDANVEEALQGVTPRRTSTSSGGKSAATSKTPESQGRRRRKLLD